MPNKIKLEEPDGRKQRTSKSRQKIVEAMLELIREGNLAPSAEQVASQAQVGLRTVFRRFNEMELLFRELAEETHRIFRPEIKKPLQGDTWQEKLFDLIDRKASIYEFIRPIQEAANYHMNTSEFIKKDAVFWNTLELQIIEGILPFNKDDNQDLFYAISGCISFSFWHGLVNIQGLSQQQSIDTMKEATKRMIHGL